MGIAPEMRGTEKQSRNSVVGIRSSSLLTPEYVDALLKRIEDREKMNGVTAETVTAPTGSPAMTNGHSGPHRLSPRRCPSAKLSKSKVTQETRRVLEKFLERSLSMNDATPMQRVYQDYDTELDVIVEDAPISPGAKTPELKTPVVTPIRIVKTLPVNTKPPTAQEVNNQAKKPYKLKKAATDPSQCRIVSPDGDVWVLQKTFKSKTISPSSHSSKSEETLKADSLLVSDDSPKSKSSSQLADHSPMLRPHSSVIAQTEFSVVDILETELSPSRQKQQGRRKSLEAASTSQATVVKADTISTSSYDQYLKEYSSKPKDLNKDTKKKTGKSGAEKDPIKVTSVQKSMTISATSYQNWKSEKKGFSNGKKKHGSRDSELDILDQSLNSNLSKSDSSLSTNDYEYFEEGKRKKKTGFKRAMERLRMSYRRKQERPPSIHSADYYAVKPKAPKPVFKKKKSRHSWKFWKKSDDFKAEHEGIKKVGLNDLKNLEESQSDDAKKGVLIKTKHGNKKPKKHDESAFDSFMKQIRKGSSTLRRRISRHESLRSPGHKTKSLDVLDESPGSSVDLGLTTSSLPDKNYLTVDTKHGRRKSPSPSGSQKSVGFTSTKQVTDEFAIILDNSVGVNVHVDTPDSPPSDQPRKDSLGAQLPKRCARKRSSDDGIGAYSDMLQQTVKSKEMRNRLKLDGLVAHSGALPSDVVHDGVEDDEESAQAPLTPNAISQKPFEDRTDEEKDIIYDRVAKKLAEIADNYVQKVESSHESSSEPPSPLILTATASDVPNPLEMRLADILRNRGDFIYENGELPTEAVKKIVADTSYNQFQSVMGNILPKNDGLQQIAVLFHMTKAAVQWAGVGAQQAGKIKELSLRYFEDKFAEWISDQGGWDSMVEDSSDFELD